MNKDIETVPNVDKAAEDLKNMIAISEKKKRQFCFWMFVIDIFPTGMAVPTGFVLHKIVAPNMLSMIVLALIATIVWYKLAKWIKPKYINYFRESMKRCYLQCERLDARLLLGMKDYCNNQLKEIKDGNQ